MSPEETRLKPCHQKKQGKNIPFKSIENFEIIGA